MIYFKLKIEFNYIIYSKWFLTTTDGRNLCYLVCQEMTIIISLFDTT